MDKIIEQITALGKGIRVDIDFGSIYGNGGWRVQLQVGKGSTKIETQHEASTLAEALEAAWNEIERVVHRGAPSMLLPQIEHRPAVDEEIPF